LHRSAGSGITVELTWIRAKPLSHLKARILPQSRPQLFSRNNKFLHRFIRQLEAEHDVNITLRAVQSRDPGLNIDFKKECSKDPLT
jgi:hypothetical protein